MRPLVSSSEKTREFQRDNLRVLVRHILSSSENFMSSSEKACESQ